MLIRSPSGDGRSPRKEVLTSPLAYQAFKCEAGVNLGLLHCDRDAVNSPYAPVGNRELQQAGIDGWLLGHIHKPDALSVESPNGYLGSLAGLDCSEAGPHGPWLISISGGRIDSVEQLPLAPLRWEFLDVDLEGIGEPEEAKGRILTALRELDRQIIAPAGSQGPAFTPGTRSECVSPCAGVPASARSYSTSFPKPGKA